MKRPPAQNPRHRYLRTAPPTARLTVPLETREGVRESGRVLRRLGQRLEEMGSNTEPGEVLAMLFQAWVAVRAAELELKLRLRIDRAESGVKPPGVD